MISITDKKSKAGRSVPAFYIQRFVCHRTICKLNRIKQTEDRRTKVLDISEEKLDAMTAVDIRTVDINTLTDIRDICQRVGEMVLLNQSDIDFNEREWNYLRT